MTIRWITWSYTKVPHNFFNATTKDSVRLIEILTHFIFYDSMKYVYLDEEDAKS